MATPAGLAGTQTVGRPGDSSSRADGWIVGWSVSEGGRRRCGGCGEKGPPRRRSWVTTQSSAPRICFLRPGAKAPRGRSGLYCAGGVPGVVWPRNVIKVHPFGCPGPRPKTQASKQASKRHPEGTRSGAASRWALGAVPEMEGLAWRAIEGCRGCELPPWCNSTKHAERQFEQFYVLGCVSSCASLQQNRACLESTKHGLALLRVWVNLHRVLLE